jgi:hypothetical protein
LIGYDLGKLFVEAVEQLLLSLGLAHHRRHFFLQMADYVRVNLGSPRTLHELVDLAFQVHKGHPLHGFAQVELKQQNK